MNEPSFPSSIRLILAVLFSGILYLSSDARVEMRTTASRPGKIQYRGQMRHAAPSESAPLDRVGAPAELFLESF
jgi:hypothetical protein